MDILSGIFRGVQLSVGFFMLGSAADDVRRSVRTFREMIEEGRFEFVGSDDDLKETTDGLKIAEYSASAGAKGYLGVKVISDALQ